MKHKVESTNKADLSNQISDSQKDQGNDTEVETSTDVLAPLFSKAVAMLLNFDSSVEKVVEEIVPLVNNGKRQERLISVQSAVDSYDFETCLSIFREWAEEEGIKLEENKI